MWKEKQRLEPLPELSASEAYLWVTPRGDEVPITAEMITAIANVQRRLGGRCVAYRVGGQKGWSKP